MKVYRIRDKITKNYLEPSDSYISGEDTIVVSQENINWLISIKKEINNLYKKLCTPGIDDTNDYNHASHYSTYITHSFYGRLEIVQNDLKKCPVTDKKAKVFKIRDKVSNKYFTGGNNFDAEGKIYSSKRGAEIALSKKSNCTKNKRKTKAGRILFSNKDFVNCEVVGFELVNEKVIK